MLIKIKVLPQKVEIKNWMKKKMDFLEFLDEFSFMTEVIGSIESSITRWIVNPNGLLAIIRSDAELLRGVLVKRNNTFTLILE
jgi:hypothetical protein